MNEVTSMMRYLSDLKQQSSDNVPVIEALLMIMFVLHK